MGEKISKLSWFSITKKYWKEQLIFYILATLSCLGNFFIDNNTWKNVSEQMEKKGTAIYTLNWDFGLFKFEKQEVSRNTFISAMLAFIAIYCLIVIAHVYYSYYFPNKVIVATKKKIVKKIFSLQKLSDQKRATALLVSNTRRFAYLAIFTPNQLYYAFLGSLLTFYYLKKAKSLLWLGLGFFCLTLLISIILQYFFFKRELAFQKPLERENKKDNFLVDNRDLILKKNLVSSSLHDYGKLLNSTQRLANKRDSAFTLSWVIPSYGLGQIGGFIFLPFASQDLVAYQRIVKLSESTKKFTERLRDYPAGLAAQKRINNFLALPERDDIQKNILITETITEIELKKVSFAYEKNNLVLKNSNWQFKKGKVNHLTGGNGTGKSTIISLIMGLYQPDEGKIIVNSKYKLDEINLIKWREKIAYAEHENLTKNGLSTGQKQLVDLNNLFANSENKEIFIFDEADNALDEENKKDFRQRIEKISQEKLVILISH